MCDNVIPQMIWDAALVGDNQHQMDVIWGFLKEKLPRLTEIALLVLVIPHSNASEERVLTVI